MSMYRIETENFQLQHRIERDKSHIEDLNERVAGLEKSLAAVVYENEELQSELDHAARRLEELEMELAAKENDQ